MTKLYHGPEGFGWQIPGKQEKKATKVEVPNAPAELADWLNDRWVQPDRSDPSLAELLQLEDIRDREHEPQLAGEPKRPKVPGHCDACGRSSAGTLKLAIGNGVDQLEAWAETVDVTNLWALGRASEIILNRARELGAEWAERSVQ